MFSISIEIDITFAGLRLLYVTKVEMFYLLTYMFSVKTVY